ncbi:MAG TPA: hypothetical protein VIM41_05360 [Gammaproteobacteria bacterium]
MINIYVCLLSEFVDKPTSSGAKNVALLAMIQAAARVGLMGEVGDRFHLPCAHSSKASLMMLSKHEYA